MNKLNLGNKLALITIACILPSVFLASFFINYQTNKLLVDEADRFIQVSLQSTHSLIEQQLRDVQKTAKVMSTSPSFFEALKTGVSSGLEDKLNTIAHTYQELFYVAIISKDHKVFAINSRDHLNTHLTPRSLLGRNVLNHPLMPDFHQSETTMGAPGLDPYFNDLSIIGSGRAQWFASPIMENGVTLGWFLMAYRFEESIGDTLNKAIDRLKAHGYPLIGGHLANDHSHEHEGDKHDHSNYQDHEEKNLYLGGKRYVIEFYFDTNELSKPLRYQTFILMSSVIPMVLILVAGLLWISNRLILKRIRNLEIGANAFTSGKFDFRIDDDGGDEITSLALSFNEMGASIVHYKQDMESQIKERTAEAEESSRFLSNVLNQAADAIITIDEKGLIRSFNQAAEEMFGYSYDEVKDRNVKMLMPESIAKHHDHYLFAHLNRGGDVAIRASRELFGVRKSGQEFPMELSVSKVTSSNGQFFTGLIRDISEKRLAQQQLAESKKQLELVVDNTAVGIWDWHLATGKVDFNRRWAQIVGYELEELEPTSIETWSSLAHPEDLQKSGDLLEQHWSGKTTHYVSESRMKHKDGHWVWVLDTGRVVEWDENGAPLRMVGTHLDITEKKQAEFEMVRLSRIANQTDNAVVVTDIHGNVEWVNVSFTRVTGYSLEEVQGKSPGSLLQGPDTDPETVAIMNSAIGKGQPFHVEILNYHKSGRPYWLDLRCNPLLDDKGELQGFMAIEADITQQKAAEEQLARQRQLLEQMSQQGRIGAWEVDLVKNKIYWSDMTRTIHEVSEDYEPDMDTAINFYKEGESRDRISQAVELGIEKGQAWHEELQLVTARGREIWVIATGNAEFKNGQCVRLFGSFQDVDSRVKQQHELAHAKEEAEQAAIVKSSFLASMSHEIRTPMNGVLGMLGLLQKSALSKEQLHHVNLAKSSGESLLTLINDILDFSKVEAGKLDLEFLDFDLRAMLGDFAESIAQKAQEKGLELILDVQGIEMAMVKGDPGRVRQILTNLVGNAIKFTDQGEVIIEAVVTPAEDNKLLLRTSIKDTGIGIPEDRQATLFDSFTQVDASTTRKYGGTGLGLAICKQLCELMSGHIEIESEKGKGSCFSFEVELEASDEVKPSIPTVFIQGAKILILDDNSTNRSVLRGQLELWGADVTEASSGQQALELIDKAQQDSEQTQFKVVFVDFQMPLMDGAEFGAKVREEKALDSVKLVMMTSISNRGDAKFFADLGFDAYFPKPTTTSDLYNALSVVIEDGEALSYASPLVTHHYLKELEYGQDGAKEAQTISVNEPTDELKTTDEPSEASWPEDARLLLVEDNYINQAVAQGVLEGMGLTCDIAGNGVEAITALRQAPTDAPYTLVLMDCQMPEMDGYQATQEIRNGAAGERFRDVSIVAMTANAMKGDKEKCLEAGMNDYLSKPIEAGALNAMLKKWLVVG